jgi:hypothetical protein
MRFDDVPPCDAEGDRVHVGATGAMAWPRPIRESTDNR